MIDNNRAAIIHADLKEVLNKFAATHGLNIAPFGLSYSDTTLKFAVQMGDKAETGDANPIFLNNTRKFGKIFGVTVEDIGKEFNYGTRGMVKFCGFKNKKTIIFSKGPDQMFRVDAVTFAKTCGWTLLPNYEMYL